MMRWVLAYWNFRKIGDLGESKDGHEKEKAGMVWANEKKRNSKSSVSG